MSHRGFSQEGRYESIYRLILVFVFTLFVFEVVLPVLISVFLGLIVGLLLKHYLIANTILWIYPVMGLLLGVAWLAIMDKKRRPNS